MLVVGYSSVSCDLAPRISRSCNGRFTKISRARDRVYGCWDFGDELHVLHFGDGPYLG